MRLINIFYVRYCLTFFKIYNGTHQYFYVRYCFFFKTICYIILHRIKDTLSNLDGDIQRRIPADSHHARKYFKNVTQIDNQVLKFKYQYGCT